MQIKIGFGFLILVIIIMGILLWRSNKKRKACETACDGKPCNAYMNTPFLPENT